MKNREHLSLYGVGPVYGCVVIAPTALGILLTCIGIVPAVRYGGFSGMAALLGAALIVAGVWLWYCAVFRAKVDDHIQNNTLATDGVYAWVRNPIYSAILMACLGALLLANNICLLILPPLYWLFLTVLLKRTEEKWLLALHGKKYVDYCRRVNRCIPRPPRKQNATC